MKNSDRELVIQTALSQYRLAVYSGKPEKLAYALNEMENVELMCSPWGTKGIGQLRKAIKEARQRLALK